MSDCSIGFEVELNEVYLLENDRDTNRNRGTEEARYLDSTPGFFWQTDEVYSVLREHDYGVEKGSNKVKFDHVSKKPYERLEFESKPIIVREYDQAVNDFDKFSTGIEAILGELHGASKTMDPTSINKRKPRSVMEEYLTTTFGTKQQKLQNRVIKRLKSMKPRQVEGTVQVTYGIPMNRYRQLLSITPFGPSVPLLETLFRQTFIGLLKVKSQWHNNQQLHPNFYYRGKKVKKIDLRDIWDSRRPKVTFVFDVRDTKVAGNLTDLLDVMNRPNSNLYNFLFLIHNYMNVLGFVYKENKNGDYYPVVNYRLRGYDERDINTGLKGTLPLMLRNKFSDIYKELLSSEEQRLFDKYTRVVQSVDSAMADIQSYYNLSSDTMLIAGFLDRNGRKDLYSYLPMAVQVPLLDVAIGRSGGGTDRNNHIIDYRLWLISIRRPLDSKKLWRAKYFKRVLQKGLIRHIYPRLGDIRGEGGVFNSSNRRSEALKAKWNRIIELENNNDSASQIEIDRLNREIDDFIDKWVEKSIKQPDADLLSPISAYASVISVVGDGRYAMGAYPIRNGQVLFECRECISGQKTIMQFQRVGVRLVGKFASKVCGVNNSVLGTRKSDSRRKSTRQTKSRRLRFPKKKRAPKKSRKPKRRSVKKSRKRRSVKKSRKPKV